jgi:hypothetical protein
LPRWGETRIWNEDDDLDPVDPILDRFPGPVVITDSMQRRTTICIGVTMFVGMFAWIIVASMHWQGPWDPTKTLFLVPAVLVCIAVELTVVAALFFDLGSLTLDAEGFEVRSRWTSRRRSWKDVSGFEAQWVPRSQRVSYINTSATTEAMRLRQSIFGNREALWYTFGYSKSDFARLLTLWRERALGSSVENR